MRIISRQSGKQQRRLSDRLSEVPCLRGENDLRQRVSGRFLIVILGKTFGHPNSGVVCTPSNGDIKNRNFMSELLVIVKNKTNISPLNQSKLASGTEI